jgi:BMFP domain-containing protein YqiC
MEQMMELMLAKMDYFQAKIEAEIRTNHEEMLAKMDDN